jgi:hypothetical protein
MKKYYHFSKPSESPNSNFFAVFFLVNIVKKGK